MLFYGNIGQLQKRTTGATPLPFGGGQTILLRTGGADTTNDKGSWNACYSWKTTEAC